MKKRVFGRKLSRDRGSREALFRSISKALIEYQGIVTTKAKAKAVQGAIDKLITLAKKENLSAKKRLYYSLNNDKVLAGKLLNNIVPVFENRKSGFTRIVNLPQRLGDKAEIVRLEWSEKMAISDKKKEVSKVKKIINIKSDKKPATQKSLKEKLRTLRQRSAKSVKKSA